MGGLDLDNGKLYFGHYTEIKTINLANGSATSVGTIPDNVENAAKAGVACIVQPGGSKKDGEVIAAADAAGIAMVFTGKRHFKH